MKILSKKYLPKWGLIAKMWETVGKEGLKACMGCPFLSGSAVAKLDEKNRFVLPQEMRYALVEGGELKFWMGLGLGGCLALYRKSDIERMTEVFQKKQHVGRFQKFFTLFFSTLEAMTCDKVGRVTISPLLQKAAGIEKEIVLAGVIDKIEIWSKSTYDANLKSLFNLEEESELSKITEEAFALLSGEEKAESSTAQIPEEVLMHLGKRQ